MALPALKWNVHNWNEAVWSFSGNNQHQVRGIASVAPRVNGTVTATIAKFVKAVASFFP